MCSTARGSVEVAHAPSAIHWWSAHKYDDGDDEGDDNNNKGDDDDNKGDDNSDKWYMYLVFKVQCITLVDLIKFYCSLQ